MGRERGKEKVWYLNRMMIQTAKNTISLCVRAYETFSFIYFFFRHPQTFRFLITNAESPDEKYCFVHTRTHSKKWHKMMWLCVIRTSGARGTISNANEYNLHVKRRAAMLRHWQWQSQQQHRRKRKRDLTCLNCNNAHSSSKMAKAMECQRNGP